MYIFLPFYNLSGLFFSAIIIILFSRQQTDVFFPENWIWHVIHNVSIGDNLHEMSAVRSITSSGIFLTIQLNYFVT